MRALTVIISMLVAIFLGIFNSSVSVFLIVRYQLWAASRMVCGNFEVRHRNFAVHQALLLALGSRSWL
jgi:hypothetical protein